ncbi:helix-turn-helix transcriptional regulator [Pedobacter aquatilis]|uniref:helix-turn-helix transcriptional regulator n=1 Tax=Pedobacter aquatilis TaxID=351343 RepID=UPI00292F2E05|nr:helix-turn-helix transcriptional regulator [Pedobacter aquatilis]
MNLDRKAYEFCYTLSPEWQNQLAKGFGTKLIGNKKITLPKRLGSGSSLFLEVMPGLSVFLLDMTFKIPISLVRVPSKTSIYMAYFDMGDEITSHILGGEVHRVGYQAKLGMAFMGSSLKGVIMPPVGERSYSLRLIMDKKLLQDFMLKMKGKEVSDKLFDESCNTLFFYANIDSRSRLLLNNLKNRSMDSPFFQLKLKSTALFLFGYLIERASEFKNTYSKLSEFDIASITKTTDYMLANLMAEFPGLTMLAGMAGMSVSKYKSIFKKILKASPNKFFLNEKLLLANILLKNGAFNSVAALAYEMGYTKPGYFAEVYKQKFGVSPSEHLTKNLTLIA